MLKKNKHAAYNIAAFDKLKMIVPNAVHLLDLSHKLNTCTKKVLHEETLKETIDYYKDSSDYFAHSRIRKYRYRAFIKHEEVKVDDNVETFYNVNFGDTPPRIVETRWISGIYFLFS